MVWEVLTTAEFEAWFEGLTAAQKRHLAAPLSALQMDGPRLGRPYVDSVDGSRHSNMKELRKKGKPLRVLFAFDPKRRAILLVGGSKGGAKDKGFYERMIRIAEDLFDRWLAEGQPEEQG